MKSTLETGRDFPGKGAVIGPFRPANAGFFAWWNMTFRLQTLKKRSDFLRARNGRYFATPGLVLQAVRVDNPGQGASCPTGNGACSENGVSLGNHWARFGFTATRKLGNAVIRNRVKRRLRAAVRQIAPQMARADTEYVLIGRKSTLKRPFSSLLQDLTIAFGKVHGNSGRNRKNQRRRHRGSSRSDHKTA